MDICYYWSQWWKYYWNIFWKRPKKTKQKEFRIEKVIKKKGNKIYVTWKDYDNLFNDAIKNWVNTFLNHMDLLGER